MSGKVLIVTTVVDAVECVHAVQEIAGIEAEVVSTRKAGLTSLRRQEYAVVVVEESLAETDPQWADEIRGSTGLAVLLEVNFSITGCVRLAQEVKAALLRRTREQVAARKYAKMELENELKSSVTGLLLESELALRDPTVSPSLATKLRHLVELAGTIGDRLRADGERGGAGGLGTPM